MSKLTDKPEQSHGHMNAGENNNSNSGEIHKLIERIPIENSPFAVVGNVETGYMLTIGKWKISEKFKTIEEVLEYPVTNMWKMVLTLIGVVIEDMKKDNEATIRDVKEKIDPVREAVDKYKKEHPEVKIVKV